MGPDENTGVAAALAQVAERAQPAVLGATILDMQTQRMWAVNGDKPLPLQSVFKLPLAIHVMHLAELRKLSLSERVTLNQADLSIFYSPIADAFDQRRTYTIDELVRAAVSDSDNTAADVLLERTGGPAALTQFFRQHGFTTFRVDRYERELQPESVGLPSQAGRMASPAEYRRYRSRTALEQQSAGMRRYLADPRDRMSATEAVRLLAVLDAGRLLRARNTEALMKVLLRTPSGPGRLKAGAPRSAHVYHKTGTGADVAGVNGATNDIGIIELPSGAKVAVAVFLSGSTLPAAERERIIADVGRIAVAAISSDAPPTT